MKNPITAFRDSFNNIMFSLGRIDAKLDSINDTIDRIKDKQDDTLQILDGEQQEKEEKPKENS